MRILDNDPKLDHLLRNLQAAEDSNFTHSVVIAWANIEEHLWREGCPNPGLALLACLALQPELIEQVRVLLPKPGIFDGDNDRRLYKKLLSGTGLSSADRLSLLSYEHYNITQVALYAQLLLAAAVQAELLKLADELARASDSMWLLEKITKVARRLDGLRKRIITTSDADIVLARPEFERRPYQKRELRKL